MQTKFSLLETALKKHKNNFVSVLDIPLNKANVYPINFTKDNPELNQDAIVNSDKLERYIETLLSSQNKQVAVGGYLEERVLYQRSPLFDHLGSEHRNIHLGIDLWTKAGTKIYAPLVGKIIGLKDNNNFADYGPTIILEHVLENLNFYSLYGHLSRCSLDGKQLGDTIKQGQAFCEIGNYPENGDWSPHLHFQLMTDMLANKHDFPGTCSAKDKSYYKTICPDPNLILDIDCLLK